MKKIKDFKSGNYTYILSALKNSLSGKTFLHVKSVSRTAGILAGRFGADRDKAKIAGILHDCAKDMSKRQLRKALIKYHIRISIHDQTIPAIWHGIIGEQIARQKFKINDKEILNAIRLHSTGGKNMGKLEKIIYAADFIEPGRKYPESKKIRQSLKKKIPLDYLVLRVLTEKVKYLKQNNMIIHRYTNLLLNSIKKNSKID